jgi:DNA-binding NarL/FixJ family response regulator
VVIQRRLLATGSSTGEVAKTLNISPTEVQEYMTEIFRKVSPRSGPIRRQYRDTAPPRRAAGRPVGNRSSLIRLPRRERSLPD